MTDDLVDFLRARLDEDEQIARTACAFIEASWRLDPEDAGTILWEAPEPRVAEHERLRGLPVVSDQWRGQGIGPLGVAPHIARHDPARVLAEVDAKRKLLAELEATEVAMDQAFRDRDAAYNTLRAERVVLARVVRRDAAVYADHPDYRDEWRP